jgi:uncharacterized repeat protein (TIGR03806 family)
MMASLRAAPGLTFGACLAVLLGASCDDDDSNGNPAADAAVPSDAGAGGGTDQGPAGGDRPPAGSAATGPEAGPDGAGAGDGPGPGDAASDAPAGDGGPSGLPARPVNTTCRPPRTLAEPATLLSATGCVDPKDPTRPAPGLIPYDVASPLWSDGAAKERFLALPELGRIHIKDCKRDTKACAPFAAGGSPEDEGDWEVPVGTVLVKTFSIGGKRVETRLLIRFGADTWIGYSYRWRKDQSDAEVLPDAVAAVTDPVDDGMGGTQTWTFPSRAQCLQCHTTEAGVSLGLETVQLNRDFRYPSTGITANQIATLERIGVFDETLPSPLAPPLPAPGPTATEAALTASARSYLHANCAICHRPGGNFSEIDLRFATAFKDTGLCNVAPARGDAGVMGALRLVPGDPAKSLLSIRMHRTDKSRMPQIGTSVVDVAGTGIIDQWIRAVKACP